MYSIQTSNKPGDVLTDPLFALGRDAVSVASGPNAPSQNISGSKNYNNNDANGGGAGSVQSALSKESDVVTQHVAHKIKVLQVRTIQLIKKKECPLCQIFSTIIYLV